MSWIEEHEPGEEELQEALDDVYGEMKGVRPNTTETKEKAPMDHERSGKPGRSSPVIDFVRSLGDYRTTKEVADELDVSEAWVRKAASKRWTQAPSYVAPFGDTHVNLYTDEDVVALRDYIDSHRVVYRRDEYPAKED